MKVVHVLFSLYVGGTETMLLDLMSRQIDEGAEVVLMLINKEHDQELLDRVDKRVTLVQLKRPNGSKNPIWLFKFNYALRKLNADAVHFHNVKAIGLLLPQRNTKYFFTYHSLGINNPYKNKLTRQFAISQAVKDDVYDRLGENTTIVYNGINVSAVTCAKSDNEFEVNGKFKILVIGGLRHEVKGQHILINAIKKLGDKNISLDLIGGGLSLPYLKGLVCDLGVGNQVNFMGIKTRKDIYELICQYHLLVLPSISEGFGLVLAEGMAAKVPVLTSNLSGPMEVIDGGRCGSYFNAEDSDDCANKLSEIISNYEVYKQIACGDAYDFVKDNFDIKVTAHRYLENYK